MKNRNMQIPTSTEIISVLIKFKVQGNIRFLSHSETVNAFQRACVRADINLQYSQGFNPRPKLSLPLPRSVGVESEDELLYMRVYSPQPGFITDNQGSNLQFDTKELKAKFSDQLPLGIRLISVTISARKAPPQPAVATYVLEVRPEYLKKELKRRIENVLINKTINLKRHTSTKKSRLKNVNVRRFIKTIGLVDKAGDKGCGSSTKGQNCIFVECEISSAGSIRVEEILKLLKLNMAKLAAPIRRTAVQWREN